MMDLNVLLREVPDGRELRIARRPEGIVVTVVDDASSARIRKLIPCADVHYAKQHIDQLLLDRLRVANATLDRAIADRKTLYRGIREGRHA